MGEFQGISFVNKVPIKFLYRSHVFVVNFEQINPLSASVTLVEKPVNWFAQQINWLVSVWGQHWHLMG